MLFSYLQKQRDRKKQKKLIEAMILSLRISPEQKQLYIEALEVLNEEGSQGLYENLIKFVEKIEVRELEQIRKESF
jgi:hypothetical protein